MSRGIGQAIDRALQSDVSPARLCRPAGNFFIYSIKQTKTDPQSTGVPDSFLTSRSVHDWQPSDDHRFELACVPIIVNNFVPESRLSVGSFDLLDRLFRKLKIPVAVISCFLDQRIQFISFPEDDASTHVLFLNFRQWCLAWRADAVNECSKAVLLWTGGSWVRWEIAEWVPSFLQDIRKTRITHQSPGIMAVLLCARHLAASLAHLDREAFATERRLRELIQDGRLKFEDELGRMSAEHSWLAARSIRERQRMSAAAAYLEYLSKRSPSHETSARAEDLDALQLLANSLINQASKLCDESSLHMSTIYNLIAQRDQATNLAIAAASREIALQSKIDQANSLAIAEASKRIAEESRKDSNAMKMVAIVTMVYLPGTFVATCFSMGVFQWTAVASEVVSPRIWVYFLFTVVLTVLTVGSFLGWTRWQDKTFFSNDNEAQGSAFGERTRGLKFYSQQSPRSAQEKRIVTGPATVAPQSEHGRRRRKSSASDHVVGLCSPPRLHFHALPSSASDHVVDDSQATRLRFHARSSSRSSSPNSVVPAPSPRRVPATQARLQMSLKDPSTRDRRARSIEAKTEPVVLTSCPDKFPVTKIKWSRAQRSSQHNSCSQSRSNSFDRDFRFRQELGVEDADQDPTITSCGLPSRGRTTVTDRSPSDLAGRHRSFDRDAGAADSPQQLDSQFTRILNSHLAAGIDPGAVLTRLTMWKPEETGESFEAFQDRVPEPLLGESFEAFQNRIAVQDPKTALQRGQNSDTNANDPGIEAVLTAELVRIWSRIQAEPSTYIMDQSDFGILNRYRGQPRFQNETARKAIERYWNLKQPSKANRSISGSRLGM